MESEAAGLCHEGQWMTQCHPGAIHDVLWLGEGWAVGKDANQRKPQAPVSSDPSRAALPESLCRTHQFHPSQEEGKTPWGREGDDGLPWGPETAESNHGPAHQHRGTWRG